MSALWRQLATLAKSLTAAELRVLLELTARAETLPAFEVKVSSRDLARTTGLVRASVQTALDSLQQRKIIRSQEGKATQSAIHRLLCFDQEEVGSGLIVRPGAAQLLGQGGLKTRPEVAQPVGQGGLNFEPGAAQLLGQGGLKTRPEVAQPVGQGGPVFGPRPNESGTTCEPCSQERMSACADSIDSLLEIDGMIDRLQKSQKSDFAEDLFEVARQQIASHHIRYARAENRLPGLPDDAITAQFLAVAEWPQLAGLLNDLAAERKEAGHSYGWYVTVALQRLRGISPEQIRQWRAHRKSGGSQETEQKATLRPARSRFSPVAKVDSFERSRAKGRPPRVEVEQLKQQIRAWAEASSL